MRIFLLSILIGLILPFCGCGQFNKEPQSIISNAIYLETYLIRHDFSDGFASLNYERMIGKRKRYTFRIGVYPDFESTISFPLSFSMVTHSKSNHHLEYGLGAVYRIEHFVDPSGINEKEWFFDWPAILFPVMYRFHNKRGLFMRMGINLFISWPTLPSPSISIGYTF